MDTPDANNHRVQEVHHITLENSFNRPAGWWLSWWEHWSMLQKQAARLIPRQDTYLGFRFDPQSGCEWEATNQCFSLALAL